MSGSFLPVGTPVDVSNCEREPIHIPGSIQPHGVLLTAVGPDDPVLQVSANCAEVFGLPPEDVLGTPLLDLFDASCVEELAMAMAAPPGERTAVPVRALVRRRTEDGAAPPLPYAASVHQADVWVVELEPEETSVAAEDTLLGARSAISRISTAATVRDLLDIAAEEVRRITGFDRVMVYRFDHEWNGQIVAEAKHARLDSLLGLHYPASDIPPQARALYRVNPLRFIRDVDAEVVPLVPVDDPRTKEPVDLSLSVLRSVSPIHCEYLRNMGVTSSMSVSLLVQGELAGLVACHHYAGPYVPSAPVRATCELLAQTLSLTLSSREQDEAAYRAARIQTTLAAVTRAGSDQDDDLGTLIRHHAGRLMRMVGASGMAWHFDNATETVGTAPPVADVDRIRRWAAEHPVEEHLVHTDRLGVVAPELADLADTAAGVLVLRISDGQDVLLLRGEEVQSIDWGGNPHLKVLRVGTDGATRLSPRNSFKKWREIVRGRSVPWERAELDAAQSLAGHLVQLLYSRHRTVALVAETLRGSLLPDSLPSLEGWCLAADSRPASAGVGGDWYDVVLLPSGRHLLAVGDVAGHGLTAASAMAQLRNALRAYAVEDDDPASVLRRLDHLTSALSPQDIATLVVAAFDAARGELLIASAGHPSPLLWGRNGTVLVPVDATPPLGAGTLTGSGERPPATRLRLSRGEALLLMSDGMFERRGESIDVSLAALTALVDDTLAGCATLQDGLRTLMAQAPGSSIDDDVTLLILGRD